MIGSIVDFQVPDGSSGFLLNDQTSINDNFASGTGFYIQISQVDGLFGSDISYESDPLPSDIGEISGDVFRRGKGLTLSGVIYANGLANLEAGCQYLQQAFWDTGAGRKIIWNPLNRPNGTPGTGIDGSTAVYLKTRINNDLIISQSLQSLNFGVVSYAWTVGLRCDDPRIYNFADDTVYLPWQVWPVV